MEIPPPIRYATRGGGSIAFQCLGTESPDLISISDPPTHLDLIWTDSGYVDVMLRLAEGRRMISYDRRGTGLSDALDGAPTLEGQALDLAAVMDEAGSDRSVLFGYGGSAAIAAYFAATRPERVDRLILLAPWDRGWQSDEDGWLPEEREGAMAKLDAALDHWGEGLMLDFVAPSLNSARNRRLFAMLERASASRALARSAFGVAIRTDISTVLPSIQAPALVLRHRDNPIPAAVVSRVADQIPDSHLVELGYEGRPRGMADFWMPVVDEINEWLTGTRSSASPHAITTLLFTDIVGSTAHAARVGDAAWRATLVTHDDILHDLVDQEGGRLIKNIGDGSLSTFDGPVQAIRCAGMLMDAMRPFDLEIRAGVHTGECERVGLDVAGMAVHVGARVEAEARPGEVLVTRAARDLSQGAGLNFASRGKTTLKGVPGQWELFGVTPAPAAHVCPAPAQKLRLGDRVVLKTARRAPLLLRAMSQLTKPRRDR